MTCLVGLAVSRGGSVQAAVPSAPGAAGTASVSELLTYLERNLPASAGDAPLPGYQTRAGAVVPAVPAPESRRREASQNRCHDDLAAAGVRFSVLAEKRGVDDPVAVRSPLGGVIWRSWGDAPMVADCRLALTLVRLGPELLRAGITELHYSGAYSYRMSRVGRLSLHAYGLAVDVHAVMADGVTFNVERDWVRNASAANCGALPGANRLLCVARRAGVFRELLGPENDADHRNHVHLGLAPLRPLPTPEVPRTPSSFGAKDGTRSGVAKARSGQQAREKPEKSAKLKRNEPGRPSAAAKPRDPKRPRPEPRETERPQPKR